MSLHLLNMLHVCNAFGNLPCNCCTWYIVTDCNYQRNPPDGDDKQRMGALQERVDFFWPAHFYRS